MIEVHPAYHLQQVTHRNLTDLCTAILSLTCRKKDTVHPLCIVLDNIMSLHLVPIFSRPSGQICHGPVGESSEADQKDNRGAGACPLSGQAERLLSLEKALERL